MPLNPTGMAPSGFRPFRPGRQALLRQAASHQAPPNRQKRRFGPDGQGLMATARSTPAAGCRRRFHWPRGGR
ncbi:hypothetical protein WB66_22615 [bacteria symbiont BFo1 of Frankliniella occidentalis]|nr:hypothetical protein AI28_00850 [bacteria symbiont BFo1 of Frankliniella occidentalis]KYP82545.1 hypothetical protein WB66_22615 [bacteria symbiont BFo1 of Frankliniella occidentalis]